MDVGASPPSWLQSSWRSRLRSRHKTPQRPPTVTPGKLAEGQAPPVIDGFVNDAVWETVTPHTTFTQQDPQLGEPATERTEVRLLFGPTAVYVSFVCFDADPTSIIVSQSKRDASLAETEAVIAVFDTFNDNQNAFVFGTNPLGIEYDGQVAREGQTSGQSFSRWRRRGGPAGRHQRVQPELGWRLDGAREHHGARLGGRDGHPAEDLALRGRRGQDLGLQRDAEYPPQERAGLPVVHPPRVRHLPDLAGGQGPRPEHAATPRHQDHSLRTGIGQQGLHAHQRPARSRFSGRDRHEVGHDTEPDVGRHGEHRLRPGRGRRRAGEPHALRPVLPREAAVLPRECLDLPVRPTAVRGSLLFAAHRLVGRGQLAPAHPDHRGRPAERKGRGLVERRRAQHPDQRRAGRGRESSLTRHQLLGAPGPAGSRPIRATARFSSASFRPAT